MKIRNHHEYWKPHGRFNKISKANTTTFIDRMKTENKRPSINR